MDWLEVKIYLDNEDLEPVTGLLLTLGIEELVVEMKDELLKALNDSADQWNYAEPEELFKDKTEDHIRFYLSADDEGETLLSQLKEMLTTVIIPSGFQPQIEMERVYDEDWENNWKQFFKPFKIAGDLVIKPTWEEYQKKPGEIVLEINPSQAFGSGQHETTAMCIEALCKYLTVGDKVADIGCGSGILALSALLLGAHDAVAVDIDEKAVEITLANAIINNLDDKITVICGNLTDNLNDEYDLITANLVAGIIIDAVSDLYQRLVTGGIVVVSGIIEERGVEVEQALKKEGFRIAEKFHNGEWLAYVGKRI